MRFYLGTGDPRWLKAAGVPLFISYRAFTQKKPPAAIAPWALDSGGFTELVQYGRWKVTPGAYVGGVRRLQRNTTPPGGETTLDFACPQDWICSPPCTEATGQSVLYHQEQTVANFIELRELAPDVNWLPILQGWAPQDYFNHVELYRAWDVDLPSFELVGIGSIALRQDDPIVGRIVRHIAKDGIELHALGVKKKGVAMYGDALASSDSMAWSFTARYQFRPALPTCEQERRKGKHDPTCQNCLRYALHWRKELLAGVDDQALLAEHPQLLEVDDSFTSGNLGQGRNSRAGVRGTAAGDTSYKTKQRSQQASMDLTEPSRRAEEMSEGVPEKTERHWDEAGTLFAENEPTEESTHDRLA